MPVNLPNPYRHGNAPVIAAPGQVWYTVHVERDRPGSNRGILFAGVRTMAISAPESTKKVSQLMKEVLSSARYLVNASGDRTDVVLSLAAWEKILSWLEDLEDWSIVEEWLPHLHAGPESSGALQWEDVSAEWDDDTTV
jgi:hypothetical protein